MATCTNRIKAYALNVGEIYSATNGVSVVCSNTFKLRLSFAASKQSTPEGPPFTLQLFGGLDGHIEYSTNLVNWVPLTSFQATNSAVTFHDPAATNSTQRFYRAVIP